jgi:acylphosphatase
MAKHLVISGRVQGVGFRYSMAEEAERLGATGWVRNRRDGTVEAVVDGPAGAADGLLAWARRGPPSAHVTGVAVSEVGGTFARFEMRPTE